MTPLDEFVARWNAVNMPIPFVEVENSGIDLDQVPDRWASAMLQGDARADVTLGSNPWVEETGQIVVGLFARSGTGRSQLDEAVAKLRTEFHGYMTPDNGLHFLAVNGPEDIDPDADGEWWRLAMTIPYRVQTRRAEPIPPGYGLP